MGTVTCVRAETEPEVFACVNCGRPIKLRGVAIGTMVIRKCTAGVQAGPGTALAGMLSKLGYTASASCGCKSRMRKMDAMGPAWCEANLDMIVGWLREAAEKQKLMFVEIAARMLVKRAIKHAKKQSSTRK